MKIIKAKTGFWSRAAKLAEQTPLERNRYIDFLRALAIGAVVLGHWIMAAAYFDGTAHLDHLLDLQPWSRWLTWIFQVMPVFFFVGGFSNGASWDGAQRRQLSYAAWLEIRMRRLLGPSIPLVLLWSMLGVIGYQTGVHPEMIKIGSQVSLVPVWFLAIYFVIVLLVPLTRAAWHRFGFVSVIVPGLMAIAADWVFLNTSQKWLGWFNYLFIWGAVHQLGYAWQQQRLGGVLPSVVMAVLGVALLVLLTQFGPYPTSLVGVPSQDLSNTTPPKLPLIALGVAQIGFLLSLERPMRRWLSGGQIWTATVLTNGFIMPIFLWHSTIMILLIGFCFLVSPSVLSVIPGSYEWWAVRPLWVLSYLLVMLIGLPLFIALEKWAVGGAQKQTPLLVLTVGGLLIGSGLAWLAKDGVAGTGLWGINWLAIMLPTVGAALIIAAGRVVPAEPAKPDSKH